LFLRSDAFGADYLRMNEAGVQMTENIRHESYGRVVVYVDLYGDKWDLIEVPSLT